MNSTCTGKSPDRRQQADAFCPSCERYMGPADTCPYCDADSARLPAWRLMRRFALLLAFVGVICLHLAMRRSQPPHVEIAEIGPAMNFGWVEVSGSVTRKPSVIWEGDAVSYLSFTLREETNYLRVVASGDVAAGIDAANMLPPAGSVVRATGTLEFDRENRFRLRLHSPDHLSPVATGAKGEAP